MTAPTRRRAVRILACAALAPGAASFAPPARVVWRGAALGAAAEIALGGGPLAARAEAAALAAALGALRGVERLFSLHDEGSALSRLNRDGRLARPEPDFVALLAIADAAHRVSGGAFDPTVQPLWRALAEGRAADAVARARAAIGWDGVAWDARAVRLTRPGAALTLNGVAQGFAADQVSAALAAHGLTTTLVDMGEWRGRGGPWRLGAAGGDGALIGRLTLYDGAAATSAPGALRIGRDGVAHILDPAARAAPRWRSVTVVADSAAWADALSTALAAAPAGQARAIVAAAGLRAALLEDADGGVVRLGAAQSTRGSAAIS